MTFTGISVWFLAKHFLKLIWWCWVQKTILLSSIFNIKGKKKIKKNHHLNETRMSFYNIYILIQLPTKWKTKGRMEKLVFGGLKNLQTTRPNLVPFTCLLNVYKTSAKTSIWDVCKRHYWVVFFKPLYINWSNSNTSQYSVVLRRVVRWSNT